MSTAGVLSGTPTTAGSYTFAVSITDANGGTGSASYTVVVSVQPPVANAVTTTVAANSSANAITLSITSGAATSVTVASPASHGTATAFGTAITYTPAAGYAGTDSFTYTATNASGVSMPATVSVTVNAVAPGAPTIGSAAAGDAQASVSFTPPASNGGAAVTSYTVTSSPGGFTGTGASSPIIVAGLANGTSYTFTVTATNSAGTSTASGATASVTPAAALAAPIAGNATASVAANSSGNPVTLSLSGGAAASVAVASQAFHGTATASGTSITYTPTPGYSGADSFTYTATNATSTSAPATVTVTVNPVAPGAPTIGSATAGDAQASVSFTPPASNGGAAVTSYTVTSSPGGFTGTGSSSPITVAGLTNGASYTFTVTATNSAGTSTASGATASVTPATALAAPIAGNATASVAANSGANPVTLALSGGTAASVAVASQALHGTATASGTSITYTPAAGYSGADSFTYTATNATGTSAPATVSMTVNAPTIVVAPGAGTLPAGKVGTAYSQAFSASPGPGPYSFAVSAGSPPAGLTLSSTGTLSGTPTAPGAASFTITATDVHAAAGSASYTLTVEAVLVPVSLSPAGGSLAQATQGQGYRQSLSASGGTGPYSFALSSGALPAGLTLDGASGGISGTPTVAGSSSFSITATDAKGASATGSFAIGVRAQAIAFVFSPPPGSLAGAMAGEAYQQPISATGGTGTKIYSLASGALPDGMILNISTGELNGPLKTGTEGDYRFAIAVTDGTGATGSASYTLAVRPRAVTVTDKAVVVADGQAPGNVYLNAGATGGPFVSADVVDVVPSNAGTAQIIEGEVAALETVRPRGFYLKFTPNPLFTGTATVGFRLTSDLGISNTGTVSYTVTVDRAAVAEKADRAVRDFVSARQALLSNHVTAPGLLDRRLVSQANERASLRIAPSGNGIGVSVATSTAQLDAVRRAGDPAAADTPLPLFNVWIDGMLLAHKQGGSSARTIDPLGMAIDTGTGDDNGWGSFALLSAGVDYLVSDRLLIGVAVHSDRMTDPGQGTSVEGTGLLAGPYASVALSPSLTLDASLLYGRSWNTVDLGSFNGSFDTTRLMATTKLEGLMVSGAWSFRPNLKLNYLTEEVDDYDVSGAGAAVAVKGFTEDDLRFSGGLTIGYLMTLSNGWTLSPELGASLGLSSANGSKNVGDGLFGTLEAGFTLAGGQDWTLQAVGTMDLEREDTQAIGGRVSLAIPF